MFKKLKDIFFEEVEEIEDEPLSKTLANQQQENRVINFTIAPEPEPEVYQQPVITKQLHQMVVEPQEIHTAHKKDVVLSAVISPMYGIVTSPVIVTTNAVYHPPVESSIEAGPLNTVTSPIYGSAAPLVESNSATRPLPSGNIAAQNLGFVPTQNVRPPVENSNINQMPVSSGYQSPLPQNETVIKPESFIQPTPNFVSQNRATKPTTKPSSYEKPLDTNLFGETISANLENGEVVETPSFLLLDDIDMTAENPKPLKRRSRKPKTEILESNDSLFDDFDVNFATKELARLMEEQDTDEMSFNKFDLFDGE